MTGEEIKTSKGDKCEVRQDPLIIYNEGTNSKKTQSGTLKRSTIYSQIDAVTERIAGNDWISLENTKTTYRAEDGRGGTVETSKDTRGREQADMQVAIKALKDLGVTCSDSDGKPTAPNFKAEELKAIAAAANKKGQAK